MSKDWPYESDPQVIPLQSPSRRTIAIALGLLAGLLAVPGIRWMTGIGAMVDAGSILTARVETGTPYVFGSVVLPRDPVTIRTVTPQVAGVEARVRISGCFLKPDHGVGLTKGSIDQICARTMPIEGLTVGTRDRWLVVAEVTQLEPGVVTIRGFDVRYRQGWRFDRQSTGVMLFMHTEGYEPPER